MGAEHSCWGKGHGRANLRKWKPLLVSIIEDLLELGVQTC